MSTVVVFDVVLERSNGEITMSSAYIFQQSPAYQDYLVGNSNPRLNVVDRAGLVAARATRLAQAQQGNSQIYQAALAQFDYPRMEVRLLQPELHDDGAVGFRIFKSKPAPQLVSQVVATFAPWRVGPWQWDELFIDSEWRCGPRWQRIYTQMAEVVTPGAVIADLGCQNGYFMFRALEWQPSLVVGFEPVLKHYYSFHLFQNLCQDPRLHFEPFGYEQLAFYPRFFDVILCLGVLYHHTDPLAILRQAHNALAPGGRLIIDCQGIAGTTPVALMPHKLYGGVKGTWWLPTLSCLQHWIHRSGFTSHLVFYNQPLQIHEQRATAFCRTRSLVDQLDPHDPCHTIEGYPAPRRFYIVATK